MDFAELLESETKRATSDNLGTMRGRGSREQLESSYWATELLSGSANSTGAVLLSGTAKQRRDGSAEDPYSWTSDKGWKNRQRLY